MTCRMRAIIIMVLATALWARSGRMLPNGRSDEFGTRLDSLDRLPPNMRYYEMLKEPAFKGMVNPIIESSTVHMVGKWGRGPSWRVTGKDSLIFLSLGSECAIVNFADSAHPVVLSEIQAKGLVASSVINDSILFIGGRGIDLWNVKNPATPVFLSRIEVTVSDIAVQDSLLYSVCSDSFRVFNVADPTNPVQIGASNDTGFSMSVARNYAYLPAQWDMGIVDISDPTHPHRVGGFGDRTTTVFARDTLAYVTTLSNGFEILDVANPQNIAVLGSIPSLSDRSDIYVTSFFAYLPDFTVIDVSIPSSPAIVGQNGTPGGHRAVWVEDPWSWAFVADDWEGLQSISIGDPTHPRRDTALLQASGAQDVKVVGGLAVVACDFAGLHLLDVSSPENPMEVGVYDTAGRYPDFQAVAATDSYAFSSEWDLRSVDITDPARPRLVGTCPVFNAAQGMAIRGSYLYVAEDNHFEIFAISQPHSPSLAGSCQLPDDASGVVVYGSYAYVACNYSGLVIVSITNPANPAVVGNFPALAITGVDVRDTLAYLASLYDSVLIVNVADPAAPVRVSAFPGHGYCDDVVDRGNRAYVGCTADLVVYDISNPIQPREVGYHSAPYNIRRVFFDGTYVYAACFGAGLCIFETLPSSGIRCETSSIHQNAPLGIQFTPNPVSNSGVLWLRGATSALLEVAIRDISGRLLRSTCLTPQVDLLSAHLNFEGLSPGVYFVSVRQERSTATIKVVRK